MSYLSRCAIVFDVTEVVRGDEFDVGAGRGQGAEEVAADPAEAVDAHTYGHCLLLALELGLSATLSNPTASALTSVSTGRYACDQAWIPSGVQAHEPGLGDLASGHRRRCRSRSRSGPSRSGARCSRRTGSVPRSPGCCCSSSRGSNSGWLCSVADVPPARRLHRVHPWSSVRSSGVAVGQRERLRHRAGVADADERVRARVAKAHGELLVGAPQVARDRVSGVRAAEQRRRDHTATGRLRTALAAVDRVALALHLRSPARCGRRA